MTLRSILKLFYILYFFFNVNFAENISVNETDSFNYQTPVLNDTEDRTSWDDLFRDGTLDESLRSKLAEDPFLVEIVQEERRQNVTRESFPTVPSQGNEEVQSRFLSTPTEITSSAAPIIFEESDNPPDVITTTTTVKYQQSPWRFSGGLFKAPVAVAGAVRSAATGLLPLKPAAVQRTTELPMMRFNEDEEEEGPGPEGLSLPETKSLTCNDTDTEYQGKCHAVLKPLPCNEGEWLVEDDSTGKGKCEASQCAQNNTVLFGDNCVRVRSSEYCHPGMMIHVYKNGNVECDCKAGYLYYDMDGNCYPPMTRGPCKVNHHFTLNKNKVPVCEKSQCADGYVCNAPRCIRQRNCVQLGSNCKCENCKHGGIYEIDATTFKLHCRENLFKPDRIVGNVPTLVCAPGTRRDSLGSCRKPVDITFS